MSNHYKHIDLEDLPKEVRDRIVKEHGIPTRKHNLAKDDVRGYAISVLSQIKSLNKSDMIRVLKFALNWMEV